MILSSTTPGSRVPEPTKVSGTRIHVPQHMQERVEFFRAMITGGEKLGDYYTGGVLFHGLPGTGKTHLVRHIAEATNANLFAVPVLSSPADAAEHFAAARACREKTDEPSILLLNELDYVGKRSEGTNTAFRPLLAQLLTEMDLTRENIGVFWFITSNQPDLLDEALRRPPRITLEVEFLPPARRDREPALKAILSQNAVKVEWNDGVVGYAADMLYGYTYGDMLGFVQVASVLCIRRGGESVSEEDAEMARKLVKPSAIRDMPFIEPTEKPENIAGGYIAAQKEMLMKLGTRIESGIRVILYGPAGCGKTALAKALGGLYEYWNVLFFDPADIVDKYVGESGRILGRIFERARALAPCLLILDQAEGVINPSNPYAKEWLSVLKSNTSEPIPGVFLALTTTDPSGWGKDILSRFKKVFIPAPDGYSLTSVLEEALRKMGGYRVEEGKALDENGKLAVDLDEVLMQLSQRRKEGGALTPRMVIDGVRSIYDFGEKPGTELLVDVLSSMRAEREEVDYNQVAVAVGDDTQVYQSIMKSGRKKGNDDAV